MKKNYLYSRLVDTARDVSGLPGLAQLKNLFRHLQATANQAELNQMRQLVASLPLEALLAKQPRFVYKYLTSYTAASFTRPVRLASIVHHYQFLATAVEASFFSSVASQPVVWHDELAGQQFSIELTYPQRAWFEGELSLNFLCGSTLVQMLTFVIVPGALVGVAAPHVLLVGQVQGTKNEELLKEATKLLHDITPACLLVNAAYGVAAALGIDHAVGISTQDQLGRGRKCYFDYDSFWQQFQGERLASQFYLLNLNAPEKPIEEVKAKYRSRTLRKRRYKQQVRYAVEDSFRQAFVATAGPAASYPATGLGQPGNPVAAEALAA